MGKSKGKSGKASAVRIGKVVAWDEKKGFGWLECDGEKIFVHVLEFRGCKQQPALGVEFPFVMGADVRGRPCAKGIHTPLVIGRMKISSFLLLLALLFWPVMGLIQLPVVWWWPVLQVTVLSAVTFRLYAYDKRQAIVKGWRVPETILHLGEIAGGWPGGFIAQRLLRHKSAKKGYQSIFWGIILIHQVIGADLFFDNRFSKEIWEVMGEAGKP